MAILEFLQEMLYHNTNNSIKHYHLLVIPSRNKKHKIERTINYIADATEDGFNLN